MSGVLDKGKLFVYHAVRDENVITCQKAVKVTQGVCDIGSGFLLFEQSRQHSRGFLRLVGFTKFGKAPERCPVGGVFFDPGGSSVPSPRGAQGSRIFAVNVDLVPHEARLYHAPARSALARRCRTVRGRKRLLGRV